VVAAINVHGSPQAGGGLLLFAGTGLDNTVSVTFGGGPATNLVHNPVPGTLQVTIPPSPLGPTADGFVDLVLTNGDGQTTTWPGFHYGNPPSATGFTPTIGAKGTVMVIDGVDFTADATGTRAGLQVSLGGNLGTITQKSPTQITVTVPKLNPGIYQVIVTNFDSQYSIAPGTFTVPGP
jgi:IPT/TIG domain